LTSAQLQAALIHEKGTGVLQRLKAADKPASARAAVPGLAALWQLLIPPSERAAILDNKFQRLIVLPDGALAQLPFETLVVKPGDDPQFLLDVGPPVLYAPSATILVNLAERAAREAGPSADRVLTVGDSRYGESPGSAVSGAMGQLAPRSRYRSANGNLKPLPYTAWETTWVADVFTKNGIPASKLQGDKATEANVCSQAVGCKVLHLACHGLVDQAYGNFFGALALTPGPQAATNPADDGFLTLAEVYQLNLKSCELAILSACETNFGPEQRGEGVWALSRGFVVAGARRVVASNWLVDDEAAASLVSYFCSGVAQEEKKGGPVDYAQSLHKAQRWVRQQDKWKSPYYWGTFVLVGPH
jgi:CHAT domain-containing protein